MERTKRDRAKFRAQYIPIEEMFTGAELMDLKQAFDAAAQGEAYVNLLSLKTLFSSMGIFPASDEMLNELLRSCGKSGEEDIISFDLFARSVALLLEENAAEKGSTSSHNEEYQQQIDEEYQEGQEDEMGEDPYYNEYDVGDGSYQ